MSDRQAWSQSVGSEKSIPSVSGTYPLLGADEGGAAPVAGESRAWSVRLVLDENLEKDQMDALSEGVPEIRLARLESLQAAEIIPSILSVAKAGTEARISVDLNLLRNVAEIRKLKDSHPEIETWVLVCDSHKSDDPESLVAETLRQLTGILAGCDVLEIRQGPNERFESLWSRVNVSRLLALEGELLGGPDPLAGAGFFTELKSRLATHAL